MNTKVWNDEMNDKLFNILNDADEHSVTYSELTEKTAVELAERGHIAVFPVMGWWKSIPRHKRWGNQARYSLIVTIKTPETEIDLYTPVANMISTPVAIEIER